MKYYVIGLFLIVIFFMSFVFAYSFEDVKIADSDNEFGVENTARNSINIAVNLGNVRANEEITINEEIAVEATLRQYADTSDYFRGDRYLNVYQVSSDPAMLAVESYAELESPILGMTKRYTKSTTPTTVTTRSREIVIFEAKDLVK